MARFVGGPLDGEVRDVPICTRYIVAVRVPRSASADDFLRIELGDDGLPVPSWLRSDRLELQKRTYVARRARGETPDIVFELEAP